MCISANQDYASIVWGNTSKANIYRLNKLLKRAARIILNKDYSASSLQMFQDLSWFTMEQRLSFNTSVLIYKIMNNMTPLYLKSHLKPISSNTCRPLRSSSESKLYVPMVKTTAGDNSFSRTAPAMWNSIPLDIRQSKSVSIFKHRMRNYIQLT